MAKPRNSPKVSLTVVPAHADASGKSSRGSCKGCAIVRLLSKLFTITSVGPNNTRHVCRGAAGAPPETVGASVADCEGQGLDNLERGRIFYKTFAQSQSKDKRHDVPPCHSIVACLSIERLGVEGLRSRHNQRPRPNAAEAATHSRRPDGLTRRILRQRGRGSFGGHSL